MAKIDKTGDTEMLYNYCIKALLPHMVYYCARILRMGCDRSLTCSRQAVGLILEKIVSVAYVTIQQIAEALGMTVDIIDQALQDLAPLKRLTPPIKGALGEALESKVTETFKVGE